MSKSLLLIVSPEDRLLRFAKEESDKYERISGQDVVERLKDPDTFLLPILMILCHNSHRHLQVIILSE